MAIWFKRGETADVRAQSDRKVRDIVNPNLKAAFFVAQACAKRMIEAGTPGSLIHMGSQMGHVGGPNRSLYCASKWALEGA